MSKVKTIARVVMPATEDVARLKLEYKDHYDELDRRLLAANINMSAPVVEYKGTDPETGRKTLIITNIVDSYEKAVEMMDIVAAWQPEEIAQHNREVNMSRWVQIVRADTDEVLMDWTKRF